MEEADISKRMKLKQVCIKFLIFFNSVGEEYQIVKRGGNIMAVGKIITWGKGNQYHLTLILKLLERISSGEGDGSFGEENQDFLKWVQGRISSCRELFTPLSPRTFLFDTAKGEYFI